MEDPTISHTKFAVFVFDNKIVKKEIITLNFKTIHIHSAEYETPVSWAKSGIYFLYILAHKFFI